MIRYGVLFQFPSFGVFRAAPFGRSGSDAPDQTENNRKSEADDEILCGQQGDARRRRVGAVSVSDGRIIVSALLGLIGIPIECLCWFAIYRMMKPCML